MITEENIAAMAADLDHLPVKSRPKTVREAIDALKPKLIQAREMGYTLEDLRAMLEKRDINVSVASLKVYLATPKTPSKTKRGGQRQQKGQGVNHDRQGSTLAPSVGAEIETRKESGQPAVREGETGSNVSSAGAEASAAAPRPGRFQIRPDRERL